MIGGGRGRYEFRVWGDGLDEVVHRLKSRAEPQEIREGTETYFVSSAVVNANPKARTGLLDIKVLVAAPEGFEQWDVKLKAEFPVAAELLTNELFPLLGVMPPAPERDHYPLDHLVAEVIAPHPQLAAVVVRKRRRMYTVGSCIAEVSDATIGGHELQTVAVESADLADLRLLRRDLGLDGRENISYPRALRNALGGSFAVD